MDQELIASTLKRAEISPLDVEFVEPHAAGSLLADAVEVTALVKSYRMSGTSAEEMLGVGSVKSLYGNAKPASGILAVLKQIIAGCFGDMVASAHLMRVNPHMLLDDMPMLIATDHVANRMNSSFTAVSAKGIGGSNVHAILWGQVDFNRVARPKIVEAQKPISYWPGGGGDLDDEAKPSKNYTIVGSWSGWADPQPMESDGKGIYGYTITLGEHAFERFHILLDGDANKVLHPGLPDAPRDFPVHGPDRGHDAEMNHWLINGQPQFVGLVDRETWQALTDAGEGSQLQWVQTNAKEAGLPGEQYRIQLQVNGQYRAVTWEKVMEGADDAAVPVKADVSVGQYYVMSSWTDWSGVHMTADKETEGFFYLETQLTRPGGTFNIVRNQDDRQTIYPEIPYAEVGYASPVLGPDDQGRAYYWYVAGEPGDVVRIEMRRVHRDGCVSMDVTWKKLGEDVLPALTLRDAARSQFFLVGTLGKWKKKHRMTYTGNYYAFELSIRLGSTESFQILMDGDWNLMLYPPEEDSTKEAWLRGPDELGQGLFWTMGKAEDERSGRFEVQLYVYRGRPAKVTWVRK